MLTDHHDHFTFYSCNFLRIELLKHRSKLLKLANLHPHELDELESIITTPITFISEELIPAQYFLFAEDILKDIDLKDVPFIAAAEYMNGILWTGDKKLTNGLNAKGYKQTITTAQLSVLFDEFGTEL